MRFRMFPKVDAKKDPDALLRLFVAIALTSIIVITSLAGFGFHKVLQRYVIDNAEQDAISMSRALLAEQRDKLTALQADGSSRVAVTAGDLQRLDRQLRRFLAPFSIVKIKIYSADYRIVYSTEAQLIGQLDSKNPRLARALAGAFDSKLETKEEVKDLTSELKFDVDVVETYIPIRDKGKVIGSFEVYIDVTKYREQSQDAAALSMGILAAIQVVVFGVSFLLIRRGTRDLKEIQDVLKRQSMTDSLTGTFNKRQIQVVARKEFSRASRRREKGLPDAELGFIMIDIDRFKEVNDSYGHLAGDILLQAFALRISGSLRGYDSIGRFGGEEFMVVRPGSDLEQTRTVAQKIWALIREEPFTLEGRQIAITASIGVSAVKQGDADYLEVLKRADQRLYDAKSGGRDRVA